MTIDRFAIATQGFLTSADLASIDRIAIATQGFIVTSVAAPDIGSFLDIEIIGTPIAAVAAMSEMFSTPIAALGRMLDTFANREIIQENADALGSISDTALAAQGMISEFLPLEDIAGDLDVEALGSMTDTSIAAEDGMVDNLDTRDFITEDPEDAEGEMTDAAIDVEGELA